MLGVIAAVLEFSFALSAPAADALQVPFRGSRHAKWYHGRGNIFDVRNPAYDAGGLIDAIDGLRKGGRGWPSSESCPTAGCRSG